jgi:predicted nuclease of predicted toxin-antitoxin system
MFPPATAGELNRRGHDALGVEEAGLSGADDPAVFDFAVNSARVMVTENFADFAGLVEQRLRAYQPCVPVVFVRKADLPRRGALPAHLARRLDAWAQTHRDPYLGPYWP